MGLINRVRKIRNAWDFTSYLDSFHGADNVMRKMDFFAFTGNLCSEPFCINLQDFNDIDSAYKRCSPLSTVIGRNAMSMANAKWWITDEKDNDKSKSYQNLSQLIKSPNPLQSFTELIIQLDTYRQLYGEVFIWSATPIGLTNLDSNALWVIKPSYIDIELTNKLYFQSDINDVVLRYYLNIQGNKTELKKENLLHIKDTYQNLNIGPLDIRGSSRLLGLEDPIKNIVQAYEAIYSLNKDRGAQGILSNESSDKIGHLPITPSEKQKIQDTYRDNYGMFKHQMKVILTDASLKWQQMSYNVKDLMLFEGIQENIIQIADAFGYPFELLGSAKGATYANKKEAKIWHYQDTIMPISRLYSEKLSDFFGLKKDRFYADFSEIEVLKENEIAKADALLRNNQANRLAYENNIISREEWRLGIGYDETIEGDTMYGNREKEDR